MPTDTVKLQFTIPRVLSIALRSAAAKDLRTQQAFLTRLLQECPAIKLWVPKDLQTNVKEVQPEGDSSAPTRTAEDYTPAELAKAKAEWRP